MTTIVTNSHHISFPTRLVQALHMRRVATSVTDDANATKPTAQDLRRREQVRCEPSSLMVGVMSRYGGRI